MAIIMLVITTIFVLFLPGFVFSFVFFSKRSIDLFERLVLSFAFSAALVPLLVFYTNILGIRITLFTVSIQIILVILVAILILSYKEIKKTK